MTTPAASVPLSWRDAPLVRVLGSALSWFLFTLSFTLLFQVSLAVMALGGSCASGGPYQIEVECPEGVVAFAPLSFFGGFLAVAVSIFLARGFGTPLLSLAWPILFVGLGGAFLMTFFLGQDLVGLIVGGLFVVMGLAPLVLELRASPQRVFIGQRAADGRQFYEGEKARRSLVSMQRPNPEGAIPATAGHWALALGVTIVFGVLGYLAGMAWFAAV